MDCRFTAVNKAIRIAHKASFQDEYDKFDELETILETVKTLFNSNNVGFTSLTAYILV